MGKNMLTDEGIDHLSEALAVNTALEHLDLFDVPFTNNGARFLERALRRNTITLKSLRLSNTRVTVDFAEMLIDAINNSVSLFSFRWVNLLPMREGRGWDRSDKDKVIQVEHSERSISLETFFSPRMGDLFYDFLSDVYKCAYWSRQVDPRLNLEKEELMTAYFDFVIGNKQFLDRGHYQTI